VEKVKEITSFAKPTPVEAIQGDSEEVQDGGNGVERLITETGQTKTMEETGAGVEPQRGNIGQGARNELPGLGMQCRCRMIDRVERGTPWK